MDTRDVDFQHGVQAVLSCLKKTYCEVPNAIRLPVLCGGGGQIGFPSRKTPWLHKGGLHHRGLVIRPEQFRPEQ